MWTLRSRAYETDLFLARQGGEVVARDRYVVVRTPSNPDFHWGNLLVYPEPPDAEAAGGLWEEDHARELPGIRTVLLGWDRPDGARGSADAFGARGFEVDESVILTVTRDALVKPSKWNADVRVSPLRSDDEWRAAIGAQTNAFAARRSGSMDDLVRFVERQYAGFRALQQAGLGEWWGAWVGGELAGSLGLVRVGGGLGRFQLVGVDPRFGRRGVCATMVHHVATDAFARGLDMLVMAADATYHAARVYESVGFSRSETLIAVIKKAPPT